MSPAESRQANFLKRYGHRWAAFRHRALAKDHQLAARVQLRTQYYLGQQYNWLFHGSRLVGERYSQTHSFCSELVARVFSDLGEPFCRERAIAPQNLLPTDIASETQGENWENVTEEYRRFLEGAPPTVVELMVDHLLRQVSEPERSQIDPRSTYIQTLTLGFKSLIDERKINEALRELHDKLGNFKRELESKSVDEQRRQLSALGVNPRSFKALYSNLLTLAFGADADLSDKERAEATEKFSVFQRFEEDKLSLSWELYLSEGESALASHAELLRVSATATVEMTEVIFHSVSGMRRLTNTVKGLPDASTEERNSKISFSEEVTRVKEPIKASVQRCVAIVREHIDSIENYDRYPEEIRELHQIFHDRFAEAALHEPRTRKLARMILQELQWRIFLLDSPLRGALARLDENSEDFDEAYQAFSAATGLISLSVATPKIGPGSSQ